jgi:ATP-binding cassette subfamily C protein CydC
VLRALVALMRGRTTLLITHRLVAMEDMDEIVVLDHGCIVERGRHACLRAAGSLYQRLLDVQNAVLTA